MTIKKFLKKDEFVWHSLLVFLGNGCVGVLNLLYYFVAVRLLSPQDYGVFNTLSVFLMFMTMSFSPLGMTLTRYFTEYITKKEYTRLCGVWQKVVKQLVLLGGVVFLGIFMLSPVIAGFLKIDDYYIIICGIVMGGSLLSMAFSPLFRSFQRFDIYSVVWMASASGRLILGTVLMYFSWRVSGALVGFLAGPIALCIVSLCFLPGVVKDKSIDLFKRVKVPVDLKPIYTFFYPSFLAMAFFSVLTTCDMLVVKHFFSSLDAGYYSIAQLMGKIILFALSALATVIFPKSTESFINNSNSSLKLLDKALLFGGAIGAVSAILSFLFPDMILSFLSGNIQEISSALLGKYALAMGMYSLLWILVNFLLASHRVNFLIPLGIIVFLKLLVLFYYHPSLDAVLNVFLLFSIFSFAITFVLTHSYYLKSIKKA